jgi:hypothetical protein
VNYIKTHLFYITLIGVTLVCAKVWLQEHDARIKAEATVKLEQASIAQLQAQISATDKATMQQIAALKQRAATVRTPAQAIVAIPDVSQLHPILNPVPNDPANVTVQALPLFTALEQCKEVNIDDTACHKDLDASKQIIADQTLEIKALKKKPSFLKRVWGIAKIAIISAGVGVLLARGI